MEVVPRARALAPCGPDGFSLPYEAVIGDPAFSLARLDQALRWLRRRRGLTQLELAEATGLKRAKVSDFERGRQLPPLTILATMLQVLDFDLADLQEALVRFQRGPDIKELIRAAKAQAEADAREKKPPETSSEG